MLRKMSKTLMAVMLFGYAFLYLPILNFMVYSFNAERQTHTWSGFSMRWYRELIHNPIILDSAWLSLKIAIIAATVSVIIGTVAALVMVRFKAFKGQFFFNTIVTAPLVMPDVMSGLALLLLFVFLKQTFGWPSHGIATITIGHITISVAYVMVIVRTRLLDFDQNLEEAALDLGAKPLIVFLQITLPLIFPALMSGWLLAFTLSIDDVVLANFLSGPGSTTLPMVIFSSIRYGASPQINALASIIVGFAAFGIIIGGIIVYRQKIWKVT